MNLSDLLTFNNSEVLIRISELMAVNRGSLTPQVIPSGPTTEHRYGRYGLTAKEAFELEYLRGIIQGVMFANPNDNQLEIFKSMVQKEINGLTIEIASPEMTKKLLAVRMK